MGSILMEAGKRSCRFEIWMIVICEVVGEIVEVQYGLKSLENNAIVILFFCFSFSFLFIFIDRASQKEESGFMDCIGAQLST